MKVVEIFGPTIQGEGALAGSVSHFVRFGGCDYSCNWCDSAHAVLPELVRSAPNLEPGDVVDALLRLPRAEWVTLSGGNPALLELTGLVNHLKAERFKVAVETQGTAWKRWLSSVDMLTISPKPPSSGMFNRALNDFLSLYRMDTGAPVRAARSCLKVPIFDRDDFDWAVKLHDENRDFPFYLSIVTRMGGLRGDFDGGAVDTTEDVIRRWEQVTKWMLSVPRMSDVRIFPQMHVLLWGHMRGV